MYLQHCTHPAHSKAEMKDNLRFTSNSSAATFGRRLSLPVFGELGHVSTPFIENQPFHAIPKDQRWRKRTFYHSRSPSAAPKKNSTTEEWNDDVEQDYDETSQRCPGTAIHCVSQYFSRLSKKDSKNRLILWNVLESFIDPRSYLGFWSICSQKQFWRKAKHTSSSTEISVTLR